MRSAGALALAAAGCFPTLPAVREQASYPTLEPDRHPDLRVPIDPYGPDPTLHDIEGDHIASDVDFGDPSTVTAMVARVQTGSLRLPSSPNHQVTTDGDSLQRVTIHVGPGNLVTRAERAEALRATTSIDSNNPAIVRAAREATSGARTDRQRVSALVSWVYTNMTYEHADVSVASVVLARASGDCSEFSLLFVALARAVHVPAREVAGLAATSADGAPAFGFHAWAEVELDGHWVQVDPTWDESAVDATHLLLGEEHGATLDERLLPLRVAVVDVKRDPALAGRALVRELVGELPRYLQLEVPPRLQRR